MDLFNAPEPPSHEYILDKHMHKQEELLNEVRELQQMQLQLLNKMESDSRKETRFNRIGFFITLLVSVLAAIGAWIPLLF